MADFRRSVQRLLYLIGMRDDCVELHSLLQEYCSCSNNDARYENAKLADQVSSRITLNQEKFLRRFKGLSYTPTKDITASIVRVIETSRTLVSDFIMCALDDSRAKMLELIWGIYNRAGRQILLYGYDRDMLPSCYTFKTPRVATEVLRARFRDCGSEEELLAALDKEFERFGRYVREPLCGSVNVGVGEFFHPRIRELTTRTMAAGAYADAVFDAFKEVVVAVKSAVSGLVPSELDGENLMHRVFSEDRPMLQLEDDITTISGKDAQKGYRYMFAGSVSAIRNPKAHANVKISRADAIRKLHFASMLMYKLDEAVKRSHATKAQPTT